MISTTTSSGPSAPHGLTTRFTYTVPANRKCLIEFAGVLIDRGTAAAVPQAVQSNVIYTPNAGSPSATCTLLSYNNTAQLPTQLIVPLQCIMLTADNIKTQDADISTGGNCTESQWLKGTEYDN